MPTFTIYNNAGDRCLPVSGRPSGTYFRPWQRFDYSELCNTTFTSEQLDMRRKAEILQYRKNQANISKKLNHANIIKTNASSRIRSQYATQPFYQTNIGIDSNVDNLPRSGNALLLPTCAGNNTGLTSESNVPGPLKTLSFNLNVPLTRHVPVRRTYIGAEGGKFLFTTGNQI